MGIEKLFERTRSFGRMVIVSGMIVGVGVLSYGCSKETPVSSSSQNQEGSSLEDFKKKAEEENRRLNEVQDNFDDAVESSGGGSSGRGSDDTANSNDDPPNQIGKSLEVVADSYVRSTQPDKNYGDNNNLYISSIGENKELALLYFQLPDRPQGRDVVSAKLFLHEAGGGNTTYPGLIKIYAAPILDSWHEDNVTYRNRPGSWLSNKEFGVHDPNEESFLEIDISKSVKEWYSGIRTNKGLILFADEGADRYAAYYAIDGFKPGASRLNIVFE